MAGVARPLALPRGWPRGLRSAAVHAVSIAEFALTTALGWAAQSLNPRLRLRAELERLRNEVFYVRRSASRTPACNISKPRSGPTIRRLRDWRSSSCGRHATGLSPRIFLVTPVTITSWTPRLNEEGPDALVRLPDPVNKFPDFVAYLVRAPQDPLPHPGQGQDRPDPRPCGSSPRPDNGPPDVARNTTADLLPNSPDNPSHRHHPKAE